MTLLKFSAVVAAATVSGAVAIPLGIFVGLNPVGVLVAASATAIAIAWALGFASERVRAAVIARIDRSETAASRAGIVAWFSVFTVGWWLVRAGLLR